VQAQDENAAGEAALQRGVNASRIYVHQPEAVDEVELLPKAEVAPPPSYARPTLPDDELERAAARLRAADWILSAIGWIYLAGAVLVTLFGISTASARAVDAVGLLPCLLMVAGLAAGGILFLGVGAALRMLALIGEGIHRG
jgi:hypothetical protein